MEFPQADDIKIVNTVKDDLNTVFSFFEEAMQLQGKNGYKVWNAIDKPSLEKDIENKLQYKLTKGHDILCIFSIQYNDPFVWRDRDRNDAIYLHRIVVNRKFKGQRTFAKVLEWAKQVALKNYLKFVRMDTWADNEKIINYYKSFGFKIAGNYQTGDSPELPIQNRNLKGTLLEMEITDK